REIPGYINRQVIDGPNIYDYVISDSVAVPKTVIFNVNPTPYTGPNIISENNTDVNQNKRIKFSEKVVETTTHTTTKGFKIGGGIKSTT
ncbi:pesticidal protein, partial [Bacillus thuringiensis]|nr:pesticidal protein [Bacillus thuringiensis]